MESLRLLAATYLLARHILAVHPLPPKSSSWDCLTALDPSSPVTFRNSRNGIEIWQPRIFSKWSNPLNLSEASYEKLLNFQPISLPVIDHPIQSSDGFMSNKSGGVYRLGDMESREALPVQIRTEVKENPDPQQLGSYNSHIYEVYLDFLDSDGNAKSTELLFSHTTHNPKGTLLQYYYLRVYLRLDPISKSLKVFLVGQDAIGMPWETPQANEFELELTKMDGLELEKISP